VKAALQIYSRDFDADFFKLPLATQRRIEAQVDRLGLMLDRFSPAILIMALSPPAG